MLVVLSFSFIDDSVGLAVRTVPRVALRDKAITAEAKRGAAATRRRWASRKKNAPDILTADNADEADKGRRTAEGIREIRVIRG